MYDTKLKIMKNSLQVLMKFLWVLLLCGYFDIVAQDLVLGSTDGTKYKNRSFQSNQLSLREALLKLESKFDVRLAFKESLVRNRYVEKKEISLENVEEALDAILINHNLRYKKIDKRHYVIKTASSGKEGFLPGKPANTKTGSGHDDNTMSEATRKRYREMIVRLERNITGKVTTDTGEPLPGVNVLIKGTLTGTVTDVEGNYKLSVPDDAVALVFSYVGYLQEEVLINGQSTINVILYPDVTALSEVVVVGYGTQKKRDVTGSVSSIKSEAIKDLKITSLDQALQGQAPGVNVTQQSGQPGGATSIRIRGGNSISAGNEPLYVIDGFPIYNDNRGSQTGVINAPPQNALANISPDDIESIEILKDASATAIYGARGANGVILVTTKRGKEGQSNVNLDVYYGVQEVRRLIPVLNARQYAEFRNDVFVSRGQNPTYSAEEVASFGEGTNWQEEIFRSAPMQNYQLSANGGSENVQYAVSAGYFNQDGIVINSGMERYALRANIDMKTSEKLKLGTNLTVSHTKSDLLPSAGGFSGRSQVQDPNGGILAAALFYNPVIPVRDENGEFTFDNATDTQGAGGGNQANVPYGNPVAYATLATNESFSTRVLGNLFADYELIEGLHLRVSFGGNLVFAKQNRYEPSTIRAGDRAPDGRAAIGNIQNIEWLNENTITYNKSFSDRHQLNMTAGFTSQKFTSEVSTSQVVEFTNDLLAFNSLQSGNVSGERIPTIFSNYTEWSLLSGIFRANYILDDKFLFTFTARTDGSSRFGDNNKWAFFPSGAFGWRLSEEPFIQNLKIFSDLKLRLSYGITGSQEIPPFQSLSILSSNRAAVGNNTQVGFAPSRIGNPDLKWETTQQFDFGLDMAFWNNRVSLSADIYYKKTNDLLLQVNIPVSSGFTQAFQNVGSLENKGVELALDGHILTGEFKWNLGANLAVNRNKVLDLGEETERLIDPGLNLFKAQNTVILREGEPIGNFYGFINDGVFRDAEEVANSAQTNRRPGQRRFVDVNNDGTLNSDDRTIIGNALPDFTGGFNSSFSYKNFELNTLFQFSVGNDIVNATQLELEFLNGRQNNASTVLNRWMPDDLTAPGNEWTNSTNPDTDVAAVGVNNNRDLHSRWVEDGSFLRLRNITLAYNLPLSNLNIRWMKAMRFYISGQNLITITDYSGYDPEVSLVQGDNIVLGFDYGAYPTPRIYTVGANITF